MDIKTLEQANLINKNIKAKKDNIDKLDKLFNNAHIAKITDGCFVYRPNDVEHMEGIIAKALIKEKELLRDLEFQFSIL